LRLRAGQSSTVFAHESPTRSAGFGTENGLYSFALTVPQKELHRMHDTGEYSIGDLAEVFSVSRPTVYRTLSRQK
jgi:hypothetical protein